eukprot:TRINITY_DN15975_c3_g1_i1.p1 TRINITY_DN15975_c3_g1~~TRINITY_DN15975_c3_g1_i1.p1  ORF type:complete len:502 (-),score=102.67 TRINITY_DN15975_c3_g1_i1:117-1622(-)
MAFNERRMAADELCSADHPHSPEASKVFSRSSKPSELSLAEASTCTTSASPSWPPSSPDSRNSLSAESEAKTQSLLLPPGICVDLSRIWDAEGPPGLQLKRSPSTEAEALASTLALPPAVQSLGTPKGVPPPAPMYPAPAGPVHGTAPPAPMYPAPPVLAPGRLAPGLVPGMPEPPSGPPTLPSRPSAPVGASPTVASSVPAGIWGWSQPPTSIPVSTPLLSAPAPSAQPMLSSAPPTPSGHAPPPVLASGPSTPSGVSPSGLLHRPTVADASDRQQPQQPVYPDTTLYPMFPDVLPDGTTSGDTVVAEVLAKFDLLLSNPVVAPLPPPGCYGGLYVSSLVSEGLSAEAAEAAKAAADGLGERPVKVLLPWYPSSVPGVATFDQTQPAKLAVQDVRVEHGQENLELRERQLAHMLRQSQSSQQQQRQQHLPMPPPPVLLQLHHPQHLPPQQYLPPPQHLQQHWPPYPHGEHGGAIAYPHALMMPPPPAAVQQHPMRYVCSR